MNRPGQSSPQGKAKADNKRTNTDTTIIRY